MSLHRIGEVSDFAPDTMVKVAIGGQTLCVANLKSCGLRAIADTCTHEDESLSEGFLCGDEVECPAHGSRFSFLDGDVSGLPAVVPVKTFAVEVQGSTVFVDIADGT